MQVKIYLMRLESILKNLFPEIETIDIYYSRRRKLVHIAFDKSINHFQCKDDILKEIERFYNINFRKDFQIIKPIRLINTIKWKFDYIIFRKRNSN